MPGMYNVPGLFVFFLKIKIIFFCDYELYVIFAA